MIVDIKFSIQGTGMFNEVIMLWAYGAWSGYVLGVEYHAMLCGDDSEFNGLWHIL